VYHINREKVKGSTYSVRNTYRR